MNQIKRLTNFTIMLMVLLVVAACGTDDAGGNASGPTGTTDAGTTDATDTTDTEAAAFLGAAAAYTEAFDRYGLKMTLDQQISSEEGEDFYRLVSTGKVELSPFAVDQLLEVEELGEQSTMRTILTQDGYYMEYEGEEGLGWRRLPASELGAVQATYSDAQVNPAAHLRMLAEANADYAMETEGDSVRIRYKGEAEDAFTLSLLRELLDSTFGGSELPPEVLERLVVHEFAYEVSLRKDNYELEQLYSRVVFDIAFVEGQPLRVNQTFMLNYEAWGTSEAIVVPEEALEAPEVGVPTDEQLEEWEELERELREELDRLAEEEATGGS